MLSTDDGSAIRGNIDFTVIVPVSCEKMSTYFSVLAPAFCFLFASRQVKRK